MDVTIYKRFDLGGITDEEIIESFTPQQRALLHNLRSDTVACMLVIDPMRNDEHRVSWITYQGQLQILNKLLGTD